MKCAIITDIHHGPDRGTKRGSAALGLLSVFQEFISGTMPDFVADLGDRISDVDHETDLTLLGDVSEFFKNLQVPAHHLLGNHDVAELDIHENEKIMNLSFGSYSFESNGVTFVIWNANTCGYAQNGFTLPHNDIDWLEKELLKISYPCVIFTHAPLDSGGMTGNFYFENAPMNYAGYPPIEAAKAREVIERSGKVVLCVNGHTHWNKYQCIDGIHYVTIPSLTETFCTYPKPHAAWAELEIKERIRIKVYGETPLSYELPLKEVNAHWIHTKKDYSPLKEKPQ